MLMFVCEMCGRHGLTLGFEELHPFRKMIVRPMNSYIVKHATVKKLTPAIPQHDEGGLHEEKLKKNYWISSQPLMLEG